MNERAKAFAFQPELPKVVQSLWSHWFVRSSFSSNGIHLELIVSWDEVFCMLIGSWQSADDLKSIISRFQICANHFGALIHGDVWVT